MAIAGLELKVDWHVNHLHRHVGEVEGGVQEDGDGHSQEDGHGGGHQGGHHGAGGKKSGHPQFHKGREEEQGKESRKKTNIGEYLPREVHHRVDLAPGLWDKIFLENRNKPRKESRNTSTVEPPAGLGTVTAILTAVSEMHQLSKHHLQQCKTMIN